MIYLLIPFAVFFAWGLIGAGVMAYIDMRYAEEHGLPEDATPFYDWAGGPPCVVDVSGAPVAALPPGLPRKAQRGAVMARPLHGTLEWRLIHD